MLMIVLPSLLMAEQSSRRFEIYNAADGLADNSAQSIICTKTGRLVITTMGQINFFDGQKFSYIDPTDENIYPLSAYTGYDHLYFDRFHHLWLKNTHSVTCVNLTTERFVPSIEDILREFGMTRQVADLFVDGRGIPWLLSGDSVFSVETKRNYPVREGHLLQDVATYESLLMLFYDDGVVDAFDLDTRRRVAQRDAYDESLRKGYAATSVLYQDSCYVYQLRNGSKGALLLRYDTDHHEWAHLFSAPYKLNNIIRRDSLLYIASEYGYWTHNLIDNSQTHITSLLLYDGRQLETDVNMMAFDKQGGLWIGTQRRGLLYSRPFNMPFEAVPWDDMRSHTLYDLMAAHMKQPETTFRQKPANCVFRDSRGWTWVGTPQGLQLWQSNGSRLPQLITTQQGLLNNVVHSVVEDLLHNVWVSTSHGISCLLIRDGKIDYITSYDEYDGIPDASFENGLAACLPDGRIIMQGIDHMVVFNPSRMNTLKGYTFQIFPKLIQLIVNGSTVRTGEEINGRVLLERALSRTPEIDLDYNMNSVEMVFSALNYFRPQHTYYRARVRGLDDEWHVFTPYDTDRHVDRYGSFHLQMMSLRPGSYVIELQASMIPDRWDTEPYMWVVNINEPWWRTTGLFVLLGFLLLALLAANVYYYLRNANMQAQRNSEEVTLLKRLRTFGERCNLQRGDLLEPIAEEYLGQTVDQQNELSPEFIDVMQRLMPTLLGTDKGLSMRDLSERVAMPVEQFYKLVNANIYKSPRPLARIMMLQKAEHLLLTTDMPLSTISEECGFVSPNYLIGSFYREKKLTPQEFRSR